MAKRVLEVVIVGNDTQLQAALGRGATGLEAFGKKARVVGAGMTRSMTLPIVAVGAASVDLGMKFQSSMEQVRTQAGASQGEVNKMSKAVLGLSHSTEQGPVALAKALYELESVGLRGSRALKTLHASSELAAVGGADLQTATSAVASAMVAWQIPTGKATQTAATLNAIVGAGKMHMQDLVSAMGTKLPGVAAQLGISLKSVGAALAAFTDQGVGAETAATNLVTPLFKMAVVTAPKAIKALASIGLGVHSLADDFRHGGIAKAVDDLHSHLQGLSKNQQTDVIANAFGGSRGSAPILQMLKVFSSSTNSVDARQKLIGENTKKFTGDVAAEHNTLSHKMKVAWSSMQASLVSFSAILAPVVTKIAGFIQKVATAFEGLSPHMKKIVVIGAAVAAVIGPIVFVVGALATAIAAIASPVGLAVLAIAGIIVAAHKMGVKFSDVKNVATTAFDAIKSVVKDMAQWVTNAFNNVHHALSNAVQWVKTAFNNVKHEVESWKVLWAVVGTIVGVEVAVVKGYLSVMAGVIRAAMGVIGAVVRAGWHIVAGLTSAVWNTIKGIVSGAAQVLKGVVQVITGIFSGNFGRMWSGIKNIFGGGVKTVETMVLAIPRAIIGAFKHLPGDMLNIGEHVITGLIDGIKSAAKGAVDAVKGVAGSVIHGAKSVLGIFSPSKVFNEIGQNTIEGYVQGLLSAKDRIKDGLNQAFVYPIDAAIAALNDKKTTLQSTWDKIDAAAQRATLVAAIGKAKHTTSLDASTGFGLTGGRSTSVASLNHRFAADAGQTLSVTQIRKIAESVGFSPKLALQMSQIAHGESSYQPGIIQKDPGDGMVGYGLLQMTPGNKTPNWGAKTLAFFNKLGGRSAMLNPVTNMVMAKYLSDHSSNPLSPWYGTAFLNRNPGNVKSVLGGANMGPTRNQLVSATKRQGADQTQIRDAIKALKDFDQQAARTQKLAKIDIRVTHLEQLKTFKDTLAGLSGQLSDISTQAADAFRTQATSDITDNSPEAQQLKSLTDSDAAIQDAHTKAGLDTALSDASATLTLAQAGKDSSGNLLTSAADRKKALDDAQAAYKTAQDDITLYQNAKTEEALKNTINTNVKALDGPNGEVTLYKKGLDDKFTALVNSLNGKGGQKDAYATFVSDVNAILAGLNLPAGTLSFSASSTDEAAIDAGPGNTAIPHPFTRWSQAPTAFGGPATAGSRWSLAPTAFGGHRASGGPVTAGTPYIVGERGQEVFVPGTNGRIIPNARNKMRSGGVTLNHYGDNVFKTATDHDRWANKLAFRLATA